MTDTTTTRPARRTVKPGGRKTANRFAKLAGGDNGEADLAPIPGESAAADTGLIGGMSAVAYDEAHRVVNLAVAEIAPHPFNDEARSQPQPEDPKWNELLNAVRANGVRLPVLVVLRETFVATRPSAAEQISPDARYVLIYGHRRRAAALEAGRDTVPAVVDDAIMDNDGDLDAMAAENLGRQDLSQLAEADLYARYSEMGLSQRAIAERLGVDQATVSRRLALLLLAPEVRAAVDNDTLAGTEAAAIASELPYGPLRRWQKRKDLDQDTDHRRAEQLEALRLVQERRWTAANAAKRVVAEREARAEAAQLGIGLIDDPEAEFGARYAERRVSRDQLSGDAEVVGAINSNTGTLDLYVRAVAPSFDDSPSPTPPPGSPREPQPKPAAADTGTHDGGGAAVEVGDHDPEAAQREGEAARIADQRKAEGAAIATAQARRREACAALITHQPSNADLLKVLVRQVLSGVAARSQTSAVKALLRDWDASVDGTGEKARNTQAWHHAVAAAELHTTELKGNIWDDDAVAHLDVLIERVGYQPSEWENRQLTTARA